MINVAEVVGLRSDLHNARLLLYMHENQLAYPVRQYVATSITKHDRDDSRDFAFGWAQLMSMLAVHTIIWNSNYNRESFLECLPSFLKTIPDKAQRPDLDWIEKEIRTKSCVLYFPIPLDITSKKISNSNNRASTRLRIAWPHRHEYDKNPDLFFETLRMLHSSGADFELVLLGESFGDEPSIFQESRIWLEGLGKVIHWGYATDRNAYLDILSTCDVAVSTAAHEFFGVAMLEAAALGVTPLAPAALAYPEIFAPTQEEEDSFFADSLPINLKNKVQKRSLCNPWISSSLSSEDTTLVPITESEIHKQKTRQGQSFGRGAITAQASRMASESSFRNSPFLYASQRDLLDRLIVLAKNPLSRARVWNHVTDSSNIDDRDRECNTGKRLRVETRKESSHDKFSSIYLLKSYSSLLLY